MKKHNDKYWLLSHLEDPSANEIFEQVLFSAPQIENGGDKQRIWKAVENRTKPHRPSRVRAAYVYAAGTAAICLICFALTILSRHEKSNLEMPRMCEAFSLPGATTQVVLPDSSRIWLKGGSSIIYPSSFDKLHEREVFISGEVYAEISHDDEKPFRMAAAGTITEVHGTQFDLKAFPEASFVEVSLVEGSVKLITNNEAEEYWMVPGERIRVDKESQSALRSKFNTEFYQSFKDRKMFYFENITLSEIILRLEEGFDIDISINHTKDLQTRYFSYFTNGESVDQILHTLDSSLEYSYTQR